MSSDQPAPGPHARISTSPSRWTRSTVVAGPSGVRAPRHRPAAVPAAARRKVGSPLPRRIGPSIAATSTGQPGRQRRTRSRATGAVLRLTAVTGPVSQARCIDSAGGQQDQAAGARPPREDRGDAQGRAGQGAPQEHDVHRHRRGGRPGADRGRRRSGVPREPQRPGEQGALDLRRQRGAPPTATPCRPARAPTTRKPASTWRTAPPRTTTTVPPSLRPALGRARLPRARVLHRAGPARDGAAGPQPRARLHDPLVRRHDQGQPARRSSRTSPRAPATTTPPGRPASSSCRRGTTPTATSRRASTSALSHWGSADSATPALRQGQRCRRGGLHREASRPATPPSPTPPSLSRRGGPRVDHVYAVDAPSARRLCPAKVVMTASSGRAEQPWVPTVAGEAAARRDKSSAEQPPGARPVRRRARPGRSGSSTRGW